MPELPEVETIRRGLLPHISGQVIHNVQVIQPKLRWLIDIKAIQQYVPGHQVVSVNRRSKYLLWTLDNDAHLVIHLGMSGRLGLFADDEDIEKHTHVIFVFENGLRVRFRDPRRFGFVDIVPPGELDIYPRLTILGPEPLSADFSGQYLYKILGKSIRPIKSAIMDASVVPGVGNIYANEALYHARIHPLRRAKDISLEDYDTLSYCIKSVLASAIEKGGTTLNDYRGAGGEPGFFQLELQVYGREKQSCSVCGSLIEKIVIGSRGTFYCGCCQI